MAHILKTFILSIFTFVLIGAFGSAEALAEKISPIETVAHAVEDESMSDLDLISEEQFEAEIKIMKEHPKSEWKAEKKKRCIGEITNAREKTNAPPGCSDKDCHDEWVKDPKLKYGAWCENDVCPLDTKTWYSKSCSNFLFDRCEVRLSNISACEEL